jgi:hypothetical protein
MLRNEVAGIYWLTIKNDGGMLFSVFLLNLAFIGEICNERRQKMAKQNGMLGVLLLASSMSHPHHPRNCTAEEGYQPAGIDAQADAVEYAIDRFSLVGQRGNQRQHEMECHPGQRGDAGYVVPFGGFPVCPSEQVHLVGPKIVAQQTDSENYQMLPVQSFLPPAKDSPGVKNKRQVHPDYRL